MTINSYGYDGTITEAPWAPLSKMLGTDYAVADSGDFKPTGVAGQAQTISFAAGAAFGQGVLVTSDSAVSVQFASIASGTRWDAGVLRRNWSTNSSSVIAITGAGSAQVIPSGVLSSAGIAQDDQLLCLAQFTAGQTQPTQLLDLRTFASKVITAASLQAFKTAVLGQEVVVGGVRYRRESDVVSGALTWEPITGRVFDSTYGWMPLTLAGRTVMPLSAPDTSSVIMPFNRTIAGGEKYVFNVINGNFPANPVLVTGYATTAPGTLSGLTIRYQQALQGNAEFDWTATYIQ